MNWLKQVEPDCQNHDYCTAYVGCSASLFSLHSSKYCHARRFCLEGYLVAALSFADVLIADQTAAFFVLSVETYREHAVDHFASPALIASV